MISVIVPIYNTEKYLNDCINSILNQSYKDIELILVNDGSIDKSLDICKSITDDRVYIIDKNNEGVSASRNRGIQIAKGEYITFVDSDDTLPPNALEILIDSITINKADMSCGSFMFQYGNAYKKHSSRLMPGCYRFSQLLNGFIDDGTLSGFLLGSVCGALYKAEIIFQNNIYFNTEIKNNEDGLFNLEYAIHANMLSVMPDCTYYYRQIESSSSSKRKIEYNFNKLLKDYIITNMSVNVSNIENQFLCRNVSLALWDILLFPKQMDITEGIKYIKKRISTEAVKNGILFIDRNNLPKHKLFFYFLIKYRLNLLIYILVVWIIPRISSHISR